jgi:hypothetical protein
MMTIGLILILLGGIGLGLVVLALWRATEDRK